MKLLFVVQTRLVVFLSSLVLATKNVVSYESLLQSNTLVLFLFLTLLVWIRYHRCEFSLTLPKVKAESSKAKSKGSAKDPVHMTPYTKWETVANMFNPAERPVVLNRASSTNTTNPFGSTFCYGYQDIIFEVSAAISIVLQLL